MFSFSLFMVYSVSTLNYANLQIQALIKGQINKIKLNDKAGDIWYKIKKYNLPCKKN